MCLLIALEAALLGRLPTLVVATAGLVVVGLAFRPLRVDRSTAVAALGVGLLWLVTTIDLGEALLSGPTSRPWLFAVPVVAFATLATGPALAWGLLAAATALGLPWVVALVNGVAAPTAVEVFGLVLPGPLLAVLAASAAGVWAGTHVGRARAGREAQVAAARRGEAAARAESEAKSRWLANVSHELRTPLNSVIGLLELVQAGNLREQERRHVEWAYGSAQMLLDLVNDLLDADQLAAGRFELKPRPADLKELLEGVERLLAPRAMSRGLAFGLELDRALPRFLVLDPQRLRQVLVNLIGNALKFTRRGSVTVRARAVNGERSEGRVRVRFEVADTGPGIAPDRLSRIFRRYEKAESSETRLLPGSGLGLAISQDLVDAMDGKIGVESKLGVGSTFWVEASFPRVEVDSPGSPTVQLRLPVALDEPVREASELRVLVVEDDMVSRELALAQLRSLGFVGEAVDRAEDALVLLANTTFAAVLMDMELPGLSGLEATQRLRGGEANGQHLVILALTGRSTPAEQAECLAAGVDDCLIKPVELKTLRQALEYWLHCRARATNPQGRANGEEKADDTASLPRLDENRLRDLDSLSARLERSVMPSLVSRLRTTRIELLEEVRRGFEAGDLDRMRIAAHTLAGSAANLGVMRGARLAKALETMAATGQLQGFTLAFDKARAELDAATSELESRYPGDDEPTQG